MFRKPLKEKKFNHLVKLLEQPEDQEFLRSCFDFEAGNEGKKNGLYTIKDDLGKDDLEDETMKRLASLAKAIKVNKKGPVNILPIIVFAALIGGGIFFFTVILDPLLSRLLTQGLENVFEARCDVRGFHLGLLRFQIRINSLTVANRDQPMKNLFETGRLEIRLWPQAVLRGKIYIEEIRADSLQFGTARTVSGALPQYAARIAARKNKPPAPPLVDLANFDAQGLLDREWDKLATPKAYDKAIAAYTEAQTRWEGQYTSANATVKEIETQGRPLLATNIASLQTPEAITKFVTEANAFIKTADAAREQVTSIVDGVQKDINTAQDLERTARSAVEADFDHLKSYLDFGSGSALEALEPSIREVLSDEAENYIMYGQRALETMEKIKALQAMIPKSQPKPEKITFKGRDVIFPTPAYPVFYLGEMASDFTLNSWNYAFDLRSVSSDPDISNRPTELNLGLTEQGSAGRQARFAGSADFRSNAQTYFRAAVSGENFPVSLQNRLDQVGIGGFSGVTGFSFNVSGGRNKSVSTGGDIRVRDPRLSDPVGTIAEAVAEAVADFAVVELGIQYDHFADGDSKFALTSNLVELIKAALQRTAQRYLRQAQDAIEKALRDRIDQYLTGKWVSKEEVDQIFAAVKGDRAAIDSIKNTLEAKKNEAEQRLRGQVNQAVDQAKEEARTQAEDAAKKTLDSALGGIKLPF